MVSSRESSRNEPRVGVALAFRSELKRFGLEKMLRMATAVSNVYLFDSAEALADDLDLDEVDVVVVELKEVSDGPAQDLISSVQRHGKRVLALIDADDEEIVRSCAHARADGFLHGAEIDTRSLCEALIQVHNGQACMPSWLASDLLARVRGEEDRFPAAMTAREWQVLRHMTKGLSNKQIARSLGTSDNNVKRLVASILAKLNCPNRTLAVAKALQRGYVGPEAY